MSDTDIPDLELEIEAARAKLATDLSRLRSPAASADFTRRLKEEAVGGTRLVAQRMFDDLKARAADNPMATLAIGAGIFWRLFRHPPIATALVGAGLFSLLRTPSDRVNGDGTADYLAHAKVRLQEQASDVAEEVQGHAAVIAGQVKDQAVAMAVSAKEQSSQLAQAAKEKVMEWGAEVEGVTRDLPGQAAAALAQQTSLATRAVRDPDTRDMFLLGTAGLAVIAALGMAYQRRIGEAERGP